MYGFFPRTDKIFLSYDTIFSVCRTFATQTTYACWFKKEKKMTFIDE